MTKEIKKIYKTLLLSKNTKIKQEAEMQLFYETGANTIEIKEKALINSMVYLAGLLLIENKKTEPNLLQLSEQTLIVAFSKVY